MDFTEMMIEQLLHKESVKVLSVESGASKKDVEELISASLPLLVERMSENASTSAGAGSLGQALKDHAGDDISDVPAFLKNADRKDGAKIIKNILGEDTAAVQKSLAKTTGMTKTQVGVILTMLAPLLLSALGASQQQNNVGNDALSGVLGSLLTGNSGGGQGGLGGPLLSALLGGGNSSNVLSTLLGGGGGGNSSNASPGAALAGNVLTSLLGNNEQTCSSCGGTGTVQHSGHNNAGASLGGTLVSALLNSVVDNNQSHHDDNDGGDLLSSLLSGLL